MNGDGTTGGWPRYNERSAYTVTILNHVWYS